MTTTLTSKAAQRTYPTRNDLPAETRSRLAVILNQTLATTLDLKTQAKQAHWNVKGMDFLQLHELFDELSGELEEFIDLVAERITALGGTAMGTARLAAADSVLPEYPFEAVDGPEHVTALADRYGIYAKHLRSAIETTANLGDADTSDLYTEISRVIDKRLWFLEAHLVKKSDLAP
jgi:starvation-inducible DNA-binding protein